MEILLRKFGANWQFTRRPIQQMAKRKSFQLRKLNPNIPNLSTF
jgi:hypothetical protein